MSCLRASLPREGHGSRLSVAYMGAHTEWLGTWDWGQRDRKRLDIDPTLSFRIDIWYLIDIDPLVFAFLFIHVHLWRHWEVPLRWHWFHGTLLLIRWCHRWRTWPVPCDLQLRNYWRCSRGHKKSRSSLPWRHQWRWCNRQYRTASCPLTIPLVWYGDARSTDVTLESPQKHRGESVQFRRYISMPSGGLAGYLQVQWW